MTCYVLVKSVLSGQVPYIHTGGWGPQHKVDFITDWDYPS